VPRLPHRSGAATSPHTILAVSAAVVLLLEYLRGSATFNTSPAWPVAQALVSGAALLAVWHTRDRLRLPHVLVLGALLQLGWIALHLHLGVHGDNDPNAVYSSEGQALLDGGYPHSEYPPGAVGLFALETWIGGGSARTPNAFLMVPFQLLCVAGVWSFRTRWAPWLSAFVALWPLNAFFWEFRFDLVPTAALVLGLLLAWRERWFSGGLVLGLGALAKWTPVLACGALVLWLLRGRRLRPAELHLAGAALPLLLVNLPLLLWKSSAVLDAYSTQNARTVTAESFVYLPLCLVWDLHPGQFYFRAADVPEAANSAAVWLQIVSVGTVFALAALARTKSSAIALAGLAPAVFLLTNRIFSPQFYVLVLAAFAVAAALLVRRGPELLALAAVFGVATTADTVLYQCYLGREPIASFPSWMVVSAISFLPAVAAVVWLGIRAKAQTADTAPELTAALSSAQRA
jgi:hypothetical protein